MTGSNHNRRFTTGLLLSAIAAGFALWSLTQDAARQRESRSSAPVPSVTRTGIVDTYPENMARRQLLEIRVNCMEFWLKEGRQDCTLATIEQEPYHFTRHPEDWTDTVGEVRLKILDGTSESFSAIANRVGSPLVWRIDKEARIICGETEGGACAAFGETAYQDALEEARHWFGPLPDGTRAIEIK